MICTGNNAAPSDSLSGTESEGGHVDRLNKFTADVRKYLNVTTVNNFTVGMLDALMLYILGVDYALLWGLLAWLLGYIPTIGFWLALISPTILVWAQYGIETAFIVFMGFVLIAGLAARMASSMRNDDPQPASRPFERERDGTIINEGAGIVILEGLDRALAPEVNEAIICVQALQSQIIQPT